MAGLKNIKLKIQSVQKTGKVTRAMEAVSAVKMRKAQERALSSRVYARTALHILRRLSGAMEMVRNPLTAVHKEGKVVIIMITSDKGLAGSLNSAVIKKAERFIGECVPKKEDLIFICLGKRGYEFAERRGYEVVRHEVNMSDAVGEKEFRGVTETLLSLYETHVIREVRVCYTNFHSTFEQRAEMHKILPLSEKILKAIIDDIPPTKGKYADLQLPQEVSGSEDFLIEPDRETVLKTLLPRLLNIAVFQKLLEAKASEHSARMVAMKNATDKSKEVAKTLNIAYNKARQAAITGEVSEITSGIEAMR